MKISYSKLFLFGFLGFIIILCLAIYSIKLSLSYLDNEDEEMYDGFRISDIKESDSTEESISIEFEEDH